MPQFIREREIKENTLCQLLASIRTHTHLHTYPQTHMHLHTHMQKYIILLNTKNGLGILLNDFRVLLIICITQHKIYANIFWELKEAKFISSQLRLSSMPP